MGFAICLILQLKMPEILTCSCYKILLCILPYPELYVQPHSLSTTVCISIASLVPCPHPHLPGRAVTLPLLPGGLAQVPEKSVAGRTSDAVSHLLAVLPLQPPSLGKALK